MLVLYNEKQGDKKVNKITTQEERCQTIFDLLQQCNTEDINIVIAMLPPKQQAQLAYMINHQMVHFFDEEEAECTH